MTVKWYDDNYRGVRQLDKIARDVAQLGSALRSGRRGRWFESSHPDFCMYQVN